MVSYPKNKKVNKTLRYNMKWWVELDNTWDIIGNSDHMVTWWPIVKCSFSIKAQ